MPKPIRHAGGTISRTQYGTWAATFNRDGTRLRSTHKSQEKAKDWLDQKAAEARMAIDPASPTEMADAAEARRILAGRCTLVEAARLWDQAEGGIVPITTLDAVTNYIDLRGDDNLRQRSMQTWRYRLNPLLLHHADRPLHTLTVDDLRATQAGSPISRNNFRRYYITFFGWALQQRHVLSNTATALTIAQADESLPRALTLDQVKALLATTQTHAPDLLPWLCIGLFAGLRSAELDRLSAQHIRGDRLHLDPSITKLRDRRILDLIAPLPAWLRLYPLHGKARRPNHRKRWTAVRAAAEITEWPDNGLRHSFCTYHLAAHRDPGLTAHYTRHNNQATLHRHYIDLATHEDGLAYFALTPEAISEFQSTP